MRFSAFNPKREHSAIERALAFALLAFIFVGTTAAAAHSHGQTVRGKVTAASFSTNTQKTSTTTQHSCTDCLICQLHQQFATSLITEPPTVTPATVASHSFSAVAVSIHSLRSTPRIGRAPPSFFV
jgi:hypothetical protein